MVSRPGCRRAGVQRPATHRSAVGGRRDRPHLPGSDRALSAARAGVQYGAQNLTTVSDSSGMQNAAKADAPNLTAMTATGSHYCQCSNGSASTCLSTDCASSHRLTYVEVNTSATYTPLVNWPGVPTTTTLTSEAIMRVNQ